MAFDKSLQDKLDELWFRLPANTPQSEKARRQSWLIREFQIHARGARAAKQVSGAGSPPKASLLVSEVLQGSTTQLPATVFPSGVADKITISCIDAWKTAQLRCPLVFQGRKPGTGDWSQIVHEGFLFHDEYQDTMSRVFVRDFTGRHPLTDNVPAHVVVGTAIAFGSNHGIAAKRQHSLNAEFTPRRVTGSEFPALGAAAQSTFRVVAGLCEAESQSAIDVINAYDTSVLSAGPYHYTGFPAKGVGPSELGAFLAYFRHRDAGAFQQYFGSFGLGPTVQWTSAVRQTDRSMRAPLGFADASGGFIAPTAKEDRDWLRAWPVFYRIQHALRSCGPLQQAIWPFARQRLSDLLSTPWSSGGPPGARTLGDVFKSELSVALLARWHVFRPAHIVFNNRSADTPSEIVKAAGLDKKDVATWKDVDDVLLVDALISIATARTPALLSVSFLNTLSGLRKWTVPALSGGATGPTLRKTRNFSLFTTGIPFPPAPAPAARTAAAASTGPRA